MGLGTGCGQQGVVAAVVVADAPPETAIAGGAAHAFDPGMFVGGDGLGGKLPANPVSGFAEDNLPAQPQSGQGSSDTTQTTAYNENVCGLFVKHEGLHNVATITFMAFFPIPCKLNISSSLIVDNCSTVVTPVPRIALWAGLANFFSRLLISI
jgi:hypothetical protein